MKTKTLTGILFVFIFFGLLFTFTTVNVLNAEEKAEKKDVKCKLECKHECGHASCCAVCKKEIDKKDAKFKAEYKGKTFYFASEKCKAEFQKNPEKYAKACCETYYVCPMKQCNVKSDKPGKCPKCGMKLKEMVKHAECCEKHKEEHKHDHKHDRKH